MRRRALIVAALIVPAAAALATSRSAAPFSEGVEQAVLPHIEGDQRIVRDPTRLRLLVADLQWGDGLRDSNGVAWSALQAGERAALETALANEVRIARPDLLVLLRAPLGLPGEERPLTVRLAQECELWTMVRAPTWSDRWSPAGADGARSAGGPVHAGIFVATHADVAGEARMNRREAPTGPMAWWSPSTARLSMELANLAGSLSLEASDGDEPLPPPATIGANGPLALQVAYDPEDAAEWVRRSSRGRVYGAGRIVVHWSPPHPFLRAEGSDTLGGALRIPATFVEIDLAAAPP